MKIIDFMDDRIEFQKFQDSVKQRRNDRLFKPKMDSPKSFSHLNESSLLTAA